MALKTISEDWIAGDHIFFRRIRSEPRPVWRVNGKHNEELGSLEVFERWNQICFFPWPETVISQSCLKDITELVETLNRERVVEKAEMAEDAPAV